MSILPQKLIGKTEKKISFGLLLFFVVIIAATLLRFVHFVKPESQPPLLTQVEGMIHLTSISDINRYTQTIVYEPEETFDSELYVVGVYPQQNDQFPTGTVSLVYVKKQQRFIEIQYRPGRTLEQELASYAQNRKESLILADKVNAALIQLRNTSYCKKLSENLIGVCQMTRALFFEQNNQVVAVFADGQKVSDGELILIAKSLIKSTDE